MVEPPGRPDASARCPGLGSVRQRSSKREMPFRPWLGGQRLDLTEVHPPDHVKEFNARPLWLDRLKLRPHGCVLMSLQVLSDPVERWRATSAEADTSATFRWRTV
jgi:hypothetical protein